MGQVSPAFDDIGSMLAPVKPRRLSVEDPLRFRKALAAIIREITGARTSAGRAPGH